MTFPSSTIAVVLAGGVGSRLAPLTKERAKPAVPFGGPYRIIDFTLSNCLHSDLRRVLVLTQYKSHSLQQHLRDGWSVHNPQLNEYITAVPPQMRTGDSWYSGTADAIYQNLYLLQRSGARHVIVLSGDHIYRMDYREILRQHAETQADVTVAGMEVPLREARSFGVMATDQQGRIREFQEKPLRPKSVPGKPGRALASMGIYVFNLEMLCQELITDHSDPGSSHDFGKDLLPRLIHTHQVFSYRFGNTQGCATNRYWRDVGTIDAYYEASMDLLRAPSPLDLYSGDWPVRTCDRSAPPARIGVDSFGQQATVTDSMLSSGVVVAGGLVERSILSPDVHVAGDAIVEDSILFDGVTVSAGARLRGCIVDKGVFIPPGESVGMNPARDMERFTVSDGGIVVIPAGYEFQPIARPQVTSRPVRLPLPTGTGTQQDVAAPVLSGQAGDHAE